VKEEKMDFKFAEVVYGVIKTHNGFTICTEVSVKKLQYDTKERLYWRTCTGITYKKLDFAMKKADDFVKRCNKNFVNFEGKQIIFKFINVGLFADSTGENNGQTDESAEKVKKIIESHYFVNQPVQA
jgi:hypothetical protein